MKTKFEVIQEVLTDFLGRESEMGVSYNDMFMGLVLDEDEIGILSTAIDEALRNMEK